MTKEPYPNEISWLLREGKFLSPSKIEQALRLPRGTLAHFINGSRELPKKHFSVVTEWVKEHLKNECS